MLITVSLLILAYLIMGKDIKPLLERVKNIDWRGKINALMDKLRPWALKAGRAATRPLLQFYYVMDDDNTSTAYLSMQPLSILFCLWTSFQVLSISSWASWMMAWQCSLFTRRLRIRLRPKSMQRSRTHSTSGSVPRMNW